MADISISSSTKYSSVNDNDYLLGNNQSNITGTWTFAVVAQWIQNKNFTQLNATTFTGNNVNATSITTTNVFASLLSASNTIGNDVLRARVNGDAFNRFTVDPRGQLLWSQGDVSTLDTRLYRPNATPNTLTLDNGSGGNADLIVTRNITCNTLNASLLNAPIPSQIDANKIYTYQSSVGTKSLRLASNSAVLTSQNVVVNNNTLTAGIINFAAAGVVPSLSDTSVYFVREINGRFSGVSSYLQGTPLVAGQFNKVNFDKAGIATGNYQIDIWLLETAIPINLNNLNYFGVNPYLDVNFSSVNGITRDGNNAIVTVGHIIQNAGGTSLPNRSFLKFTGTGVSVTDGISGETLVTINGNGDLSGPASSGNNSIPVFDGTTGKLVKNSSLTYFSNGLFFPTNGFISLEQASSDTVDIFLTKVSGNPNNSFVVNSIGLQKWSNGVDAYDTSIQRSGVATLQLKRFDTNGAATLDTTGGTFIGNTLRSSITDAALTLSTTGSAGGANIILDPGANGEAVFRNNGQNIARILISGLKLEDYVNPLSSAPMRVNLGNSFSNIIGQMPKLIIRDNGGSTYGIGVSALGLGASGSQMDYIVPSAAIHSHYIGAARRVDINNSGITIYSAENQLVLGAEGATTTTITSPAPAASRVYTIPDAGGAASFVMTASNQTISGTKTFSSAIPITATTNQLVLGTTNTTTITAPAPAASRVYTIPDAGAAAQFVMTASNQTIAGTKTFSSGVPITATTNQLLLGTTNTTTITAPAPAASRVYTIPDAGGAASFVMTAGNQTIAGTKTFSATVLAPSINEQLVNAGVTIQGATICRTNGIMVGGSHTISGTRNAIIGGASCSITSGTDCVLVGSNMIINSAVNNSVGIGNYINVNATGAVGIADNSTTTNLTLGNNTFSSRFSGGYVLWSNSTTTVGVQVAAGGNSWVAISDVRKKKDIVDIDCQDVYSKVKQLPVFTYKYIDDDSEQIRLGTSANDFNDLFGDGYIEKNIDGDGYNLISSADVTYVLLATVKELQNKVENLEKTLH